MKKIASILLCLLLILNVGACKPDNITYPKPIIDPSAQEQQEEAPAVKDEPAQDQPAADQPAEEQPIEEEPAEDQPIEEVPAEEAPAENEADQQDAAEEEQPEEESPKEEAPIQNPLAAEGFAPSQAVGSSLPLSGLTKKEDLRILRNRTIHLFTAGEDPAFHYVDEKGNVMDERQWMEALAKENSFILKYSIKKESLSLRAQRIALWAGKKLSLIQMPSNAAADGLTLSRSAEEYLDLNAESFGISKAVLEQSGYRLLAPRGMVKTLWYDPSLLPEGYDPAKLQESGEWTVEKFNALCAATAKEVKPLELQDLLAWGALGEKSPLTLLEGKLDSNINAMKTRPAWEAYAELPVFEEKEDTDYSQSAGNLLMDYTEQPKATKDRPLLYAPLPALEGEGHTASTFCGTYLALPKYGISGEAAEAALLFAELWCNRYTECRAKQLMDAGVSGAEYEAYCAAAEENGVLILYCPAIEALMAPYFEAIATPDADLQAVYDPLRQPLLSLIAARNLYY